MRASLLDSQPAYARRRTQFVHAVTACTAERTSERLGVMLHVPSWINDRCGFVKNYLCAGKNFRFGLPPGDCSLFSR
jgi:hypothetical protein